MKKFDFINPPSKEKPGLMADLSNKKILMGFWHNWLAGFHDGYQQGSSTWLNLTDVPVEYIVCDCNRYRRRRVIIHPHSECRMAIKSFIR